MRPAVAWCSPPDPVHSRTTCRRSSGGSSPGHAVTSPASWASTAVAPIDLWDETLTALHGTHVALEDVAESSELTAPSAEAEAIARDAARRAWLLREHAALATARGDDETTSRLRAAASAADRVAQRTRRHTPPSSRNA